LFLVKTGSVFELRRYRGDTPLSGLASSGEVSRLLTVLNQQGWAIDMAAVDLDGELLVVCERPAGTHEPGTGNAAPLGLVDRVVLQDVRLVRRPDGPGIVAPDHQLGRPRARRWQTAEVSPGSTTIVLRFGRGVHEGLHSIEVAETPTRVVVTVNLGVRPEFTKGSYSVTPVLVIERAIVELSTPLGERPIVDGAA
jgi:hypothetical protein